jgi:ABC-2 type transport system ATP-binding protein
MIEVEHLTKKYGDLVAVRDLSFKVAKGKIWGLLGPNAAGKTTTMRVLTGYIPATDGKATVAGFDVFEQPNAVKRVTGYLPEVVPLYPEMTVSEHLSFVAALKQVPAAKRKPALERAIQVSGLASVKGRLIKNISRGFKQRVGIAQSLIHNPDVLILDEPTIGLDPAQIIEIRELIKALKGEHTIILSTHILAEVTQTCDGVVIINEGRLMASGSLEELTASFREKDRVILRLRRGHEDALTALRAIPGVEEVTRHNGELAVEWNPGKDLRENVSRMAVEKEWGLLEMRTAAMNIEDLYLRVVSGGGEQ